MTAEQVPHLEELRANGDPQESSILNALAAAIIVVDLNGLISSINLAAEQFLAGSAATLRGCPLSDIIPGDSPIFSLVNQVRTNGNAVYEYGLQIESPRTGQHFINVQATLLPDFPEFIVLAIQERSIADKIDRQLTHRGAARSLSAMGAMLAHEIKNPLSGIRGAAQLLEQTASDEDRPLTQIIRDEADRVCSLVDRMEVFSDAIPLERKAVNIHQVLSRVRQLAENGFGQHIKFIENYDPSLPFVYGNKDQLIQTFLNLVKNACEACPKVGGEVVLNTAYKHGVRFTVPGTDSLVHLPLVVNIQDNGEGIPEDIQEHLFDPFVTLKFQGTGLGLPLVAKIIGQHGGVIEFDSIPRRTIFRVMLPTETK
jgi:two-component system, NtrC family, nitrogen regulation sensor histidine kinase GlnL